MLSDELRETVLQPSLVVGVVKVGVEGQLIVALAPTLPMVGAVRSTVHVAVRDIVELLLQRSVAVNVLV